MRTRLQGSAMLLALMLALPATAPADPAGAEADRPEAVAIAAAALQEADTVYRAARRALSRGEYERAADLFRQVADAGGENASEALYYLGFALYQTGRQDNLRRALTVLDQLREQYPSAASRGDAEELATRIEGALAQRGDARAAERLAREAERMERDPDDEVKLAALNALLQVDSDKALPILKRVIARRDEGSAELRRHAMFLLAQHETDETVDIMLDAARNDPDQEVREQAVFWLAQVDDPRAFDALVGVLENPADAKLHETALFAIAQHDDGRAAEVLRDYARRDDVPDEVRGNAIFWLGQRGEGDPETARFLRGLFAELQDPEARERTLFSLAQMGGEENVEWLLDVALDESLETDLRKTALFWAGQNEAVDVGRLAGLYDRAADREMKEQLLFVFAQRDDPAAFDKLLEIARDESDAELRKTAVFWIGQSDDPRAQEVLLEILEQ